MEITEVRLRNFNRLLVENDSIISKVRNIGKYPYQSYEGSKQYRIRDWLQSHNLFIVFCNAQSVCRIDSGVYAVKRIEKWEIIEIDVEDYFYLFPNNIPFTKTQFVRWIGYVGKEAQQSYRKRIVSVKFE